MGWLLVILGLLSWRLTAVVRRYAQSRWVDVPNARSSHTVPTPRGGGLAVVVTFGIALVVFYGTGWLSGSEFVAFTGAGLLVAGVGLFDDRAHIAARWRLLAHFAAAAWGLYWLGGLPGLPLMGHAFDLGLAGDLLTLILLVWLLNLYNFMDGIDGIAGIEAVTVGGAAAILLWLTGAHWGLPLALAVSAFGFLLWNFPPAKIFLGDVGSGFMGLTFGLLMLHGSHQSPDFFWAWLILLGTFVVDATVTLATRLLHGEAVHEAHRSHAYQYLARRWSSHRAVSLLYGAVNLLWLVPIAWFVATGRLDGVLGVCLAYLPLALLAVLCKAGNRARQESEGHMGAALE